MSIWENRFNEARNRYVIKPHVLNKLLRHYNDYDSLMCDFDKVMVKFRFSPNAINW